MCDLPFHEGKQDQHDGDGAVNGDVPASAELEDADESLCDLFEEFVTETEAAVANPDLRVPLTDSNSEAQIFVCLESGEIRNICRITKVCPTRGAKSEVREGFDFESYVSINIHGFVSVLEWSGTHRSSMYVARVTRGELVKHTFDSVFGNGPIPQMGLWAPQLAIPFTHEDLMLVRVKTTAQLGLSPIRVDPHGGPRVTGACHMYVVRDGKVLKSYGNFEKSKLEGSVGISFHTIDSRPGDSGACVFNSSGDFVGVHTGSFKPANGTVNVEKLDSKNFYITLPGLFKTWRTNGHMRGDDDFAEIIRGQICSIARGLGPGLLSTESPPTEMERHTRPDIDEWLALRFATKSEVRRNNTDSKVRDVEGQRERSLFRVTLNRDGTPNTVANSTEEGVNVLSQIRRIRQLVPGSPQETAKQFAKRMGGRVDWADIVDEDDDDYEDPWKSSSGLNHSNKAYFRILGEAAGRRKYIRRLRYEKFRRDGLFNHESGRVEFAICDSVDSIIEACEVRAALLCVDEASDCENEPLAVPACEALPARDAYTYASTVAGQDIQSLRLIRRQNIGMHAGPYDPHALQAEGSVGPQATELPWGVSDSDEDESMPGSGSSSEVQDVLSYAESDHGLSEREEFMLDSILCILYVPLHRGERFDVSQIYEPPDWFQALSHEGQPLPEAVQGPDGTAWWHFPAGSVDNLRIFSKDVVRRATQLLFFDLLFGVRNLASSIVHFAHDHGQVFEGIHTFDVSDSVGILSPVYVKVDTGFYNRLLVMRESVEMDAAMFALAHMALHERGYSDFQWQGVHVPLTHAQWERSFSTRPVRLLDRLYMRDRDEHRLEYLRELECDLQPDGELSPRDAEMEPEYEISPRGVLPWEWTYAGSYESCGPPKRVDQDQAGASDEAHDDMPGLMEDDDGAPPIADRADNWQSWFKSHAWENQDRPTLWDRVSKQEKLEGTKPIEGPDLAGLSLEEEIDLGAVFERATRDLSILSELRDKPYRHRIYGSRFLCVLREYYDSTGLRFNADMAESNGADFHAVGHLPSKGKRHRGKKGETGEQREAKLRAAEEAAEAESQALIAAINAWTKELLGESAFDVTGWAKPPEGRKAGKALLHSLALQLSNRIPASEVPIKDPVNSLPPCYDSFADCAASFTGGISDLVRIVHGLNGTKSAGFSRYSRPGTKSSWMGDQSPATGFLAFCRLALWHSYTTDEIAVMQPAELVLRGLADPRTPFLKSEFHNPKKSSAGKWRIIWPLSVVDETLFAYVHGGQNKADIEKYQSGNTSGEVRAFVGVGHDDPGIEHLGKNLADLADADGIVGTADASGWDLSVKRTLWLADALRRIDCFERGSTRTEQEREFFTHSALVVALVSSAHTFCVEDNGKCTVYQLNVLGPMPSAHPSTSDSNSFMRGAQAYSVLRRRLGVVGDDLAFRGRLSEEEKQALRRMGCESRNVSDNQGSGKYDFNSHYVYEKDGKWVGEFQNVQKLFCSFFLKWVSVVDGKISKKDGFESAVHGGLFALRNTPDALAGFESLIRSVDPACPLVAIYDSSFVDCL